MSERVLVLGATGMLGQPVARHLKDSGYSVRIMTRNAEKAGRLFGDGFEIVEGEAAGRADLRAALAGCTGVHISVPTESELAAAQHIVSLAPESDLKRITYVSACTVAEKNRWFELVDVKMRAEEVIRNGGIPYTILCPTWVMDTLHNFVHGDRAVAIVGKRPIFLHFFATDDFGRMVAAAYGKEETVGKRLFVHGPEAIELREATERYVAACHPEIGKLTVMPVWLARLMGALLGRDGLKFASQLISYFDRVGEMGDPTEANELLGAPTITLDAWIEEVKTRGPAPYETEIGAG